MTFLISSLLAFAVAVVIVSVLINHRRASADPDFELTPNCLLTRLPLLFVTGPRSVFYFKKYWNIYPAYLAEHGYEVYTLHLPWRSRKLRQAALTRAFSAALKDQKRYHLVVDSWTQEDLEKLPARLLNSAASVNLIGSPSQDAPTLPTLNLLDEDSKSSAANTLYRLHRRFLQSPSVPSLAALGGTPEVRFQNARLLLERAQVLAERDLLEIS